MAIISIGLACYDQFFFINAFPEENTKSFSQEFIESGGGPCANAAYLLGLWGEDVYYVGHLNDDIYGKKIIAEFENAGVNVDNVIISPEMMTPLASVLVNRYNGSRTIITRKLNTPPELTLEHRNNIDKFIKTIKQTENEIAILIDGHEPELSEYIIQQLPEAKVIMDAGSLRESNLHLAKYTDYLVASEIFARNYIGVPELKYITQIEHALIELTKIARGNAFITLGEKGCAYLKQGKAEIIPSYLCNVLDTTGAGDVFHGAFTYGVYYDWNLENIITFASLAAAISIEKKGVREAMPDLYAVHKAENKFEKNMEKYSIYDEQPFSARLDSYLSVRN